MGFTSEREEADFARKRAVQIAQRVLYNAYKNPKLLRSTAVIKKALDDIRRFDPEHYDLYKFYYKEAVKDFKNLREAKKIKSLKEYFEGWDDDILSEATLKSLTTEQPTPAKPAPRKRTSAAKPAIVKPTTAKSKETPAKKQPNGFLGTIKQMFGSIKEKFNSKKQLKKVKIERLEQEIATAEKNYNKQLKTGDSDKALKTNELKELKEKELKKLTKKNIFNNWWFRTIFFFFVVVPVALHHTISLWDVKVPDTRLDPAAITAEFDKFIGTENEVSTALNLSAKQKYEIDKAKAEIIRLGNMLYQGDEEMDKAILWMIGNISKTIRRKIRSQIDVKTLTYGMPKAIARYFTSVYADAGSFMNQKLFVHGGFQPQYKPSPEILKKISK